MRATYDDSIQMDALLLNARILLAEAEEITTGQKVRITFYAENTKVLTGVYPHRVACYARRAIGVPALVSQGLKLIFYSRGVAVRVLPTIEGYTALAWALTAHINAVYRRNKRRLAKLEREAAKKHRHSNRPQGGEGKEAQP
jgi:hypothetical protein